MASIYALYYNWEIHVDLIRVKQMTLLYMSWVLKHSVDLRYNLLLELWCICGMILLPSFGRLLILRRATTTPTEKAVPGCFSQKEIS